MCQQIKYLSSHIPTNKINFIIKNLPSKKTPSQDDSTVEFYETCKEKIMSILHKLRKWRRPDTPMPKPDNYITKIL